MSASGTPCSKDTLRIRDIAVGDLTRDGRDETAILFSLPAFGKGPEAPYAYRLSVYDGPLTRLRLVAWRDFGMILRTVEHVAITRGHLVVTGHDIVCCHDRCNEVRGPYYTSKYRLRGTRLVRVSRVPPESKRLRVAPGCHD